MAPASAQRKVMRSCVTLAARATRSVKLCVGVVLAPFFRRVTDAAVFLVEILMRVNCAGIWIAITLK